MTARRWIRRGFKGGRSGMPVPVPLRVLRRVELFDSVRTHRGFMDELYRLAKRVAITHNGKNFPRREQIDAITRLQTFFKTSESPPQPTSASEQAPSMPPSSKP